MMNDNTKMILSCVLGIIAIVMLLGGLVCDIISDHWPKVIQANDWCEVIQVVGLVILLFAEYLRPITSQKEMERAGWNCFYLLGIMCFFGIIEVGDIEHFTTPIVVILVIAAILAIPACIFNYKKWLKIKAQLEEQEK